MTSVAVILLGLILTTPAGAQTPTGTSTKVPAATQTPAPYELYLGKVTRVVDGDTVEVELSLGWGNFLREKVRLFGINTPEMPTTEGVAAKDHLFNLIFGGSPTLMFRSMKDKRDKYGRILLVLHRPDFTESINDRMVRDGHAVVALY